MHVFRRNKKPLHASVQRLNETESMAFFIIVFVANGTAN